MKKSQRIAGLDEAHFPGVPTFNTRLGGYSPLAWMYRSILDSFTPREWMVLTYLLMRSGPDGICWPTDKTIGVDIGLGPKKVGPHLRRLAERGFIVTRRLKGRRYVKLVDPMTLEKKLLGESSFLGAEQRQRLFSDYEQILRTRNQRLARQRGE